MSQTITQSTHAQYNSIEAVEVESQTMGDDELALFEEQVVEMTEQTFVAEKETPERVTVLMSNPETHAYRFEDSESGHTFSVGITGTLQEGTGTEEEEIGFETYEDSMDDEDESTPQEDAEHDLGVVEKVADQYDVDLEDLEKVLEDMELALKLLREHNADTPSEALIAEENWNPWQNVKDIPADFSEKQREAWKLTKVEGWEWDDAADYMGIERNTLNTHLDRCYDKLRDVKQERLMEQEYDE